MEEILAEHAADFIEQLLRQQRRIDHKRNGECRKADVLADMENQEAEAILAEMTPGKCGGCTRTDPLPG